MVVVVAVVVVVAAVFAVGAAGDFVVVAVAKELVDVMRLASPSDDVPLHAPGNNSQMSKMYAGTARRTHNKPHKDPPNTHSSQFDWHTAQSTDNDTNIQINLIYLIHSQK